MRRPLIRSNRRNTQAGFTITELMITVGLSLSIISSVLLGYLATYTSSMNTLAGSKMNQDMNALMSLMVSELRRAGYSGTIPSTPAANLFSQVDNTALEIFNSIASNTQQAANGSGTCIVYSYDMDEDGVVDAAELSGFRLNAGVVQIRTAGNTADPDTCATASNSWVDLTDSGFITVSALTFNMANSECLNTREPDEVDNDVDATVDEAQEADCYDLVPTGGSGDIIVETREIAVTVTANLTSDSFVRMSQTQTVRVRNDMVRVR